MPWVLPVSMQVAVAVAAPAEAGVTFDEALGLARQAPSVTAGERAAEGLGKAAASLSSMSSNPQVTLQPGGRIAPAADVGPELVISVSQSWNLAGLGEARKTTLKAEGEALRAEARAAALAQRLGAAKAWLDLWAAQKLSALASAEAGVARDLAKLAEKARAAEAATKADDAEARAYHAEARLMVIDAEGAVFELAQDLAREIAKAGTEPITASGEPPEPSLPEPGTWATALTQVERLPAVQAKALAQRAEKARAAEEGAARGTQLSLGVVVQKDGPQNVAAFGMVGVTVPLFDRGQRERAPVLAREEKLAGEKASATIDARTELSAAFHHVRHSGEIVAAVRDELLPPLTEAADAREAIFRAGDGTMVDVLAARRRVIAAKARLVRARADNAWAKVKVWLLLAELQGSGERARKEGP